MANPDRNRKLLVRSVFATGSTLAILLGAQSLALSDAHQFAAMSTENADDMTVGAEETASEQNLTIVQAAPSITILRQTANLGTNNNSSSGGQSLVLQPPVASLAATPEPMIVQSQSQQPVISVQSAAPSQSNRQQTRSSR